MPFGRAREVSIIGAVALSLLMLGVAANIPRSSASSASTTSTGGVFDGQTYSGVMEGGYLYENNSFPFESYAATSHILALPELSAWLASNGYSLSDLRPYLTMYPSTGNPYDFSQGALTENGTTYYDYQYLVTNSTNGLVISALVNPSSQAEAKISTYDTSGPDIAYESLGNAAGGDSQP